MDATALRWILVIIGVVVILAVYLFSIYQNKLRRNAAIKTFTQDELESGVIEDETLRDELSHINTMLDQEVDEEDIASIKITPAVDTRVVIEKPARPELTLPFKLLDLPKAERVAHVLKPDDDHLLTSTELLSALKHAQLKVEEDGLIRVFSDELNGIVIASLTEDGSLSDVENPQFTTPGLACYFSISQSSNPLGCYEFMLKKIDELVRVLDLKVYDEDLHLLTLQHVTDTRRKIKS